MKATESRNRKALSGAGRHPSVAGPVAPLIDEDGAQVTPARSFGYDTLVLAIGSQSNDFGTPGVAEHALRLETMADARAFHRRLVNACIRAHAQR